MIPITGILIGGTLTATSLAGHLAVEELAQRRGEVEAALSVGLSDRDGALELRRAQAATALISALDQTAMFLRNKVRYTRRSPTGPQDSDPSQRKAGI